MVQVAKNSDLESSEEISEEEIASGDEASEDEASENEASGDDVSEEESSPKQVKNKPSPLAPIVKVEVKTEPAQPTLYCRAPWIRNRDVALAKLTEASKRILHIKFPRQKHANFCYVEYRSAKDRDVGLKELKDLVVDDCKLTVDKPSRDKASMLEKVKDKVAKKRETKRELTKTLKNIKKQQKIQNKKGRSTQIFVSNIPRDATREELEEQFGSLVDFKLKHNQNVNKKSSAYLTLATPHEAKAASQKEVSIRGTTLRANLFGVQSKKAEKKSKNKKEKKSQAPAEKDESADETPAPPIAEPEVEAPAAAKPKPNKGKQPKTTKRYFTTNDQKPTKKQKKSLADAGSSDQIAIYD